MNNDTIKEENDFSYNNEKEVDQYDILSEYYIMKRVVERLIFTGKLSQQDFELAYEEIKKGNPSISTK